MEAGGRDRPRRRRRHRDRAARLPSARLLLRHSVLLTVVRPLPTRLVRLSAPRVPRAAFPGSGPQRPRPSAAALLRGGGAPHDGDGAGGSPSQTVRWRADAGGAPGVLRVGGRTGVPAWRTDGARFLGAPPAACVGCARYDGRDGGGARAGDPVAPASRRGGGTARPRRRMVLPSDPPALEQPGVALAHQRGDEFV